MYLLPTYLTFISFFICFFFGRVINNVYAGLLSTLCLFTSFCAALYIFYEVALCQSPVYVNCGDWMVTGLLEVKWTFLFDSLTVTMLLVILGVSLCAHMYSVEYMLHDPHQTKFMSYLSLFTFNMLLLVTSSNFVILFLGWEGVGIRPYLLINFWHSRLSANKSAVMAMFVNKIGDVSLLIAFTILYLLFYSFDYSIIFSSVSVSSLSGMALSMDLIFFVGILFVVGAIGKSAQIGLHTWLPEAMEGPTPVSSLIHAATMVTAGIFLVIRSNVIFQILPEVMVIIISVGSLTAFLGSSIGVFQLDIKKIVAYSTCSQLGYMFLACGLNGYQFSIYHLTNHAFFKALLFLVAGYIIHAINNEQDIRRHGGLLTIMPFAYVALSIGSFSLLGFPFFSGYFSKEKIIELFYSFYSSQGEDFYSLNILLFFQLLASIAVTFTILYSVKVSVHVFFYAYQNSKRSLFTLHYSSWVTVLPLFFLAFLSVASGYILEDMMIGISSDFWNYSIFNIFAVSNINYFEFNLLTSKLPIISIFYFMTLFFFFFYVSSSLSYYAKISSRWADVFVQFFNRKYFVFNKNIFYPLINFTFRSSYFSMYSFFDKGLIEIFGPFGIVSWLNAAVVKSSRMQTGFIYHYSGFIVLGLMVLISFISLVV